MPVLSAQQMSVLQYHANSGDRIAYYSALSSYGFPYGELSLGVVLNNTPSGGTANSYFLSQAAAEGIAVTADQLASVSVGLMMADLQARVAAGGADLSADDIQFYHEAVFGSVTGVSANGWTPNRFLMTFMEPADRQAAWELMLNTPSPLLPSIFEARGNSVTNIYLQSIGIPVGLFTVDSFRGLTAQEIIDLGFDSEFANWFHDYYTYLGNLIAIGIANLLPSSNSHGPFEITHGSGNHVIGGNQGENTLQGTSGNDVIIGFDGDDIFYTSGGSDRYYGGPGGDHVSYTSNQSGIHIQIGQLQENAVMWEPMIQGGHDIISVIPGWSRRDFLVDIESVSGSSADDVIEIHGSFEDIVARQSALILGNIDGGDHTVLGDIVDLSRVTSETGLVIEVTGENTVRVSGTEDNPGEMVFVNFEGAIGTSQNDTMLGNDEDNILIGGAGDDVFSDSLGNDVMFGGDGNDYFNVSIDYGDDGGGGDVEGGEDTPAREIHGYDIIDGGAGRDTLVTSGTVYRLSSGDFALADDGRVTDIIRNIEVIEGAEILDLSASTVGIHFDGDHSFTFGEDLVEIYGLFEIMGSQGSDTMTANEDIWLIHGGDGDDQLFGGEVVDFRLTGGRGNDLIEGGDGFAYGGDGDDIITLESGEATGGDGNDIITITGSGIMDGGAGSDVLSGGFGSVASGDANDTLTIGGISITGNGRVFSTLGNFAYGIVRENLFEQDWVLMVRPVLIQPTFDGTQSSIMWQGFLVSNVSEAILDENGWYNGTSDGIVYFRMGDFGLQTEALGYDTGMGAARITYTDPVTGQRVTRFISDLPVGNLAGSDTTWPDYYENAELSIDGDFNWDGADGFGGGTTSDTDNGSNIRSGDGNLRLSNFDPSRQTLVVNGVALSASTLATGMTATEVAGSTVIQYGQSETITLSGVSLADWTTGSAAQIHGAAGDDELTGTSAADVIASGGGNDTMTGGNGDDLFIYTSGHDVIIGHNNNKGNDTLDLSQYSAADVTFAVSGNHVLITTPDGSITLQDQVRNEIGNFRSNIETVLFSDGTLDEAGIRDRALVDQMTSGDDIITGTQHADTLNGGNGNDTIYGGNGDDTFIYTAGHDLIHGHGFNGGNDTLVLSQYNAADVTFSVLGNNVLITTPDGSITLGSQVANAPEDPRTNIETIVFADGTLDEAGIRSRSVSDQASGGNDSITGTAYNDVISGGAGNDTLNGGAGDDLFIYTSGHDVIIGHNNNKGNDTLDLSQYSAADVTFAVSGNHVLITTPDGSITLQDQVRNEIGNFRSNIETVLFSDGILDDAGIRTRAVSDATTGGSTSSPANAIAVVSTTDSGDMGGNDSFVFLPDASPDLPPPLRHVYDDGLSAWLQGSVKGLGHSARLPASDLQADHHETGALLAAIFAADSLSASQYELL